MNIVYWGILAALALLQILLIVLAWRHLSRRLRAWAEAQRRSSTADASTATLIAALARIEQRLAQLESGGQPVPAAAPQAGDRAYDLAQRMARNGADAAQIAESCGIALHEAQLLHRLHAPSR